MSSTISALKRLLIGRAVRSDRLGESLLPKRIALPVFASDPLSSVAYATQEILLILSLGGVAFLQLAPWVGLAVVVLLTVVVMSYRQVVQAYPSGGGSYEVASRNLGRTAGLVVAGALLVDYVMTVAVSVAAGVDNIISAVPSLNGSRVWINVFFIVGLTAMNLRGIRESGKIFAIPTYLFVAGVALMITVGLTRTFAGHPPVAESAGYGIRPDSTGLTGLALVFLLLRSFASGCTALTGVEAISNGVPAFRKPKSLNAARTMSAMGIISIVMFSGITALALITKVRITENTCDLIGFAGNCATDPQRTVISQIAASTLGGDNSGLFYFLQGTTALILILAANTAFNGFPLLCSILAEHRFLPRQLNNRGDRLSFSNGIIVLSAVAVGLIVLFGGSTTRLIQLYIVGVFTSFTLCQAGMVRHWRRELSQLRDRAGRARLHRSLVINGFGAVLTGVVLVVVLVTKFTHGAYLVVVFIPVLFVLMLAINRHYRRVKAELVPDALDDVLPSRVHAIVLVSELNRPALRAIAFARASRPDTLTALTVDISSDETRRLTTQWEQRRVPIPLKVIDSPFREITRPILNYLARNRSESPRDLFCIYIPEYVIGHWWANILHNQTSLRLKGRLLFEPRVMVTSVPWQLSARGDQVVRTPVIEQEADERSESRAEVSVRGAGG